MGSGKTEAAIAVYAQWAKTTGDSGLVCRHADDGHEQPDALACCGFLGKQFGQDIEPLLVHSQALLRDAPDEDEAVEEDDEVIGPPRRRGSCRARKACSRRSRRTVDQALMSILQTNTFSCACSAQPQSRHL